MFFISTNQRLRKYLDRALQLPEDIYLLDNGTTWSPSQPLRTELLYPVHALRCNQIVLALQLCIDTRNFILEKYGDSSPHLQKINQLFFVPYYQSTDPSENEERHRKQWIQARKELVDLLASMVKERQSWVLPFYQYLPERYTQRLAGGALSLISFRLFSTAPPELFQVFLFI